MLRSGAARSALRSVNTPAFKVAQSPFRQQFASQLCTAARRPQALAAMKPLALVRFASSLDKVDIKHEAEKAKETIKATPDLVSTESSTRPAFGGEVGVEEKHDDHDMMAGIHSDMKTIKETFSLEAVPKEAYWIGMAGVVPYMATSLSTVYAAWEINHAATTGTGFLLNEKSAELLLHVLEPLQIGYGATIISFLGAIHWGLEFAGFGGKHGYKRYQIGVLGAALAWPTILLPVESALISQFLIFNFMYYTDSRASKRGWAPAWYGVYRFVLTFIVGSAIVASLIGRGQIADRVGKSTGPADKIKEFRESQVQMIEEEEEARRQFLGSEGGDDEEEEEEEDDE